MQDMMRWKRIEERTEDGFGNEESGEFWKRWIVVCVMCKTEGRCEVDEEGRRVVEVRVYRKRWR